MGNVETPHGSLHKKCSCEKICHTMCSETLSLLGPSSQTGAAHLGLGMNSLRSKKTLSWENKKNIKMDLFSVYEPLTYAE